MRCILNVLDPWTCAREGHPEQPDAELWKEARERPPACKVLAPTLPAINEGNGAGASIVVKSAKKVRKHKGPVKGVMKKLKRKSSRLMKKNNKKKKKHEASQPETNVSVGGSGKKRINGKTLPASTDASLPAATELQHWYRDVNITKNPETGCWRYYMSEWREEGKGKKKETKKIRRSWMIKFKGDEHAAYKTVVGCIDEKLEAGWSA
jgi:hypothetical protein